MNGERIREGAVALGIVLGGWQARAKPAAGMGGEPGEWFDVDEAGARVMHHEMAHVYEVRYV